MDVILGILIALVGLLLIVVIKLTTTFFHEMGHAIPALLFTNKSVDVYIGSYGDISRTTNFQFGRLKIYFKWNIFDWKMGMCQQEEPSKYIWQRVLIILGGPIASLIISIPLLLNLRSFESNDMLFFVSLIFIAASGYDFIVNMIPYSSPIAMHDGSIAHCDGFALFLIAQRKIAPKEFFVLEEKTLAEDYEGVIALGEELLREGPKHRYIYEAIIGAMVQLKNYDGALSVYKEINNNLKLEDNDYFEIGKLHKSVGNYEEALKFFNHYRYKNYGNIILLNEIGMMQIALGKSETAIKTLSNLIHLDEKHLPAFVNRSRAYINEKEYALAEIDLNHVMKLTKEEPMAHFLYGRLQEEKNNFEEALTYYEAAKRLACEQHGLDFRIENLKLGNRKGRGVFTRF